MSKSKEVAVRQTMSVEEREEHASNIREAIAENMSGQKLNIQNLEQVKVPSGGNSTWEFTNIDGEEISGKELVGVILEAISSRAYYSVDFATSGGGTPPDCSSADCVTGVGSPGGNCSRCPLGQFGSGKNGGQACSERRRLFLFHEQNDIWPIVLNVPSTSISPLGKYMFKLSRNGKKRSAVETIFTIEKTKSATGIEYGKIKFEMGKDVEDVEYMVALKEQITPLLIDNPTPVAADDAEVPLRDASGY